MHFVKATLTQPRFKDLNGSITTLVGPQQNRDKHINRMKLVVKQRKLETIRVAKVLHS
jgi:hypothetical protein